MAITGVTTNYTGRTKDLMVTQGINPLKAGPQSVTYTFGSVSSYIAGVQKLVQRYVISLFNTGLLDQLLSARNSNIQEASHIFNFASWSVIEQFKAYQAMHPEVPEDEQLSTAQLIDIQLVGDRLHLKVQIITKAGTDIPFVLPISL